jgi:Cdc6-like AAA superfamily ATPase
MLEQCFTEDAQLRQYQRDLSQALKDTPPSFLPANQTEDQSPGEGKEFLLQETGNMSGRVILVVGSVGCGKSTLVQKVIIESKIQKISKLRILKLDLINEVKKTQGDVFPILWKYLVQEWKQNEPDSYKLPQLREYFDEELLELREGESSELFAIDKSEYIRAEAQRLKELKADHITFFARCWRHYRSQGYGITLVIDNIDRASEDFQEQVYGFSHELADRTGATIIVTMREFTFFRAKDEGFLDVRQEDGILHLKSPNLEQLLSRRIKYIEKHLDEDFRVKVWRQEGSLESIVDNSKKHSKTLKETFLENENGRKILGIPPIQI